MDTPLGTADASFLGEAYWDEAGEAVAGVGDVNGDGFDDFLVGATGNDQVESNAGMAYLFLGRADGWTTGASLDEAAASFLGVHPSDHAGAPLAGLGDINGDGFDDFAIRSIETDGIAIGPGQVYVFHGQGSGWEPDTTLASADASFVGEDEWEYAGKSVAGAGDVDGDGLDDYLIGVPFNDEAGSGTGQVYVLLGATPRSALGIHLSESDASFLGGQEREYAGEAVASAGDVNGDGLDDILIGAPDSDTGADGPGRAYLVLGHSAGWSMDTSLNTADACFSGEGEEDGAGWSVAGVGDIDGDGLDEFVVGAPYADSGGASAGQVYLFAGRQSGWSPGGSLALADVVFHGEAIGDRAGATVSGIGDADGDGLDDLLIGAPYSDGSAEWAGQSYLVRGRTDLSELGGSLAYADASFLGEVDSDSAGSALAGAGDVNGDGYDDLLIGAMGNDEVDTKAGKVYLLLAPCPDLDRDGHSTSTCGGDDCNDDAATTFPGAPEQCDGLDNDCDGAVDEGTDVDGDGDGYAACEGDCHDLDAAVYPGATEHCDGWDGDCDGGLPGDELDLDGDGSMPCEGDCDDDDRYVEGNDVDGDGASTCDGDCDDQDSTLSPTDADGDGWSSCDGDCDDADALLELDDVDGDGFSTCDADCDDTNADRYPQALELCNGIDESCNGIVPETELDGDGDGLAECEGDCNDFAAAIHPMAAEDCADGVDNDCDQLVDSFDDDCHGGDDDSSHTPVSEGTSQGCSCSGLEDTAGGAALLFATAVAALGLRIRRRAH